MLVMVLALLLVLELLMALDQELDLVHQGVKRLGVMATEMNTELKIQKAMIDETKQKAEDVNTHLLEVNKKMKRALESSGGASKMCINIICVIILLSSSFCCPILAKICHFMLCSPG